MDNWKCPICGEFVVESKSGNEVFGRCFYCGYSWNHIIEENRLEKNYEKNLNF